MAAVGIDTSSYGFHVVSDKPIMMPGAESPDDQPERLGWCRSSGDAQSRRWLTFVIAQRFFASLPAGSTVAIEEPLVLPKNIVTTMVLVMMAGVIEAAYMAASPDATLYWVNVSSWRRAVLNPPKGQAPRNKDGWKALARQYLLDRIELFPYSVEELRTLDAEPDLYDAACLMQYARSLT